MRGEPLEMGYCHCENCRRYSAAPVSAFTLWKWENVKLTKGAEFLGKFKSSDISDRRLLHEVRQPHHRRSSNARPDRCSHRRSAEFSVQTKGAPQLRGNHSSMRDYRNSRISPPKSEGQARQCRSNCARQFLGLNSSF